MRWLILLGFFGAVVNAAPGPKVHTVSIEAMKFVPAELSVSVGDTIVWVNRDMFIHSVTSATRVFDSGIIVAGKSWTLLVQKPGTFAYGCKFHLGMKGTVTVK
jgi:plastocyanin